ncbi:hypothetical protein Y032_0507g2690 [Ancylostoma ceylanicum]|uniref:Uncharacterized protein n=1 Tax=Ancylostoma ceylanicum TaxID=53326 RepID=A0A016WTL8_9BILA|nr:hypothetical protein Y032_0507g2690 [Ancylostoma ceylanicum]
MAIKKMKAGIALGTDGIPVEALRSLGEVGVMQIPEACKESIIVPIFKSKGDAMNCANYKGIKLIAYAMNI